MLYLSWFISSIFCCITYLYLFNKVLGDKKFKMGTKEWIYSIIFSLIYVFIMHSDIAVLRPYIIHLMFFIGFIILYHHSIIKTLIGELYVMLLILSAELTCSIILTYILKIESSLIVNNYISNFIINIVIYLLALLLSKIEFIGTIYYNFVSSNKETRIKKAIIFSLEALTLAILALYINFTNRMPSDLLLFTNAILICGLIFIVRFFKEKNYSNNVKSEYDNLIDYVKNYEKIIDEKSKNQHEYKNQLVVIKNLVKENKNKALDYINALYNEETDNEHVDEIKKLSYLPNGGLKGLIYYKIEQMHLNDINVFINISKQISSSSFRNTINDNLYDITHIVGVYLDNAIEACLEANTKAIIIEAYVENDQIIFSFSNTYSGVVELNKVDKEGYTTKGQGHGYGLSLVKDLLHSNENLIQEKVLNGMYYTQKLIINKSK